MKKPSAKQRGKDQKINAAFWMYWETKGWCWLQTAT